MSEASRPSTSNRTSSTNWPTNVRACWRRSVSWRRRSPATSLPPKNRAAPRSAGPTSAVPRRAPSIPSISTPTVGPGEQPEAGDHPGPERARRTPGPSCHRLAASNEIGSPSSVHGPLRRRGARRRSPGSPPRRRSSRRRRPGPRRRPAAGPAGSGRSSRVAGSIRSISSWVSRRIWRIPLPNENSTRARSPANSSSSRTDQCEPASSRAARRPWTSRSSSAIRAAASGRSTAWRSMASGSRSWSRASRDLAEGALDRGGVGRARATSPRIVSANGVEAAVALEDGVAELLAAALGGPRSTGTARTPRPMSRRRRSSMARIRRHAGYMSILVSATRMSGPASTRARPGTPARGRSARPRRR